MKRQNTKSIQVGNLILGGNHKIYIQSMTNTKTSEIAKTVAQIKELEKNGVEIIRVAILDKDDALAIKKIKESISVPLVADIHFNYNLAILAILNGADKIRLNPGNIKDEYQIKKIVDLCKERNIAIRIGVNSGSLPNLEKPTVRNMLKALKRHLEILENLDFHNIVLSLKSSNLNLMIKAYQKASKLFPYPLHLGVTEAGTLLTGSIKSAIGIGYLLKNGIGNTIRVSLTDDPNLEVLAAKEILKDLELRNDLPDLISCPTCGRTMYNMIEITKKIEKYLVSVNKKIVVAIMGCIVNGPGEAKHADIGIAGGVNEALLFKKGKVIRKIKQDQIYDTLIAEIEAF